MVDIPRPDIARSKQVRRLGYIAGTAVVVSLISLGIFRLKPAPPGVDRRTVYVATVEQGQMLRDVRGSGTLVPEEIRWISAITNSTVERIVLQPGVTVQPDTVIVELSNPQLEQSALEAQLQLEAAQARYQSRQVALDRELLTQQASVATILSELTLAEFEAQQHEKLFAADLVSELDLRKSQSKVSQLGIRHQIEEQRLEIQSSSIDTELAAGALLVRHPTPDLREVFQGPADAGGMLDGIQQTWARRLLRLRVPASGPGSLRRAALLWEIGWKR